MMPRTSNVSSFKISTSRNMTGVPSYDSHSASNNLQSVSSCARGNQGHPSANAGGSFLFSARVLFWGIAFHKFIGQVFAEHARIVWVERFVQRCNVFLALNCVTMETTVAFRFIAPSLTRIGGAASPVAAAAVATCSRGCASV